MGRAHRFVFGLFGPGRLRQPAGSRSPIADWRAADLPHRRCRARRGRGAGPAATEADLERQCDLHRRRAGGRNEGLSSTKRNLDVELINFGGSTDQLLEAIATGKADAGVGMALRWLKPLEQGFDVKITAGTHGGCMRLLALPDSGITKLADLKGKAVGVSDMAAPDKNFFSIRWRSWARPTNGRRLARVPADLLAESR